jgi:hypothetical protein
MFCPIHPGAQRLSMCASRHMRLSQDTASKTIGLYLELVDAASTPPGLHPAARFRLEVVNQADPATSYFYDGQWTDKRPVGAWAGSMLEGQN